VGIGTFPDIWRFVLIPRRLFAAAALAATVLGLSACDRVQARAEAEVRTAAKTLLNVPHRRQETLLCVPTSTAMVLAFYGDDQPPRRLKALASGVDYRPDAPFSDFSITLYRDMIRGLERIGYDWGERDFADTSAGFDEGIGFIEQELAAGRPVLVDVSLSQGGHTFVIRGFDHAARQLFIVDPSRYAPGRATVTYDQFATVWNEHAYGSNVRGLMNTRPKSA
jgi:hypothetical protein